MKNFALNSYATFLEKAKEHTEMPDLDMPEVLKWFFPKPQMNTLRPTALYFIDYVHHQYIFLDTPADKIFGYPVQYLVDAGPGFVLNMHHPEDYKIVNTKTFPANMDFLEQHLHAKASDFAFTITYRLKSKEGIYHFVSQRSCYLSVASDGTPLSAIGSVSDITPFKSDSRIIHMIENCNYGNAADHIINYFYPEEGQTILSRRELDVLKWVCEGLSSKQIADKLYLSIHTINNHRKNMLEKTNCRNVPELLNHALKHGIL